MPDAVIHGLQQAQCSLPVEELEGALVVRWPAGVELMDLRQVHRAAPLTRRPCDIVPVMSQHLRVLLQRGLGALVPCRVQPAQVAPDGLAGLARHVSACVVLDSPVAHAVLHAGRAGHRLPHGQRLFKGAAALAKLRVPRLAPKVPLHAQQARLVERRLPAQRRHAALTVASAEDEVHVLRVRAGLKVRAVRTAHDGLGRLALCCEGVSERHLQEAWPLLGVQVRIEGGERDWLGAHAARWREGIGAQLVQLGGAERDRAVTTEVVRRV
eukprot:scaffold77955_cov64-Phaeocystis_antarctica.AAC.2